MATREFNESLKLEENIFQLNEDIVVSYLIHFAAPFTGGDKITISAGTRFAPYGPMRDDARYMAPIELDENLIECLDSQTKSKYIKLSNRIQGYSFFITEAELKDWNIAFIQGSKQRLLEIFKLIRESNITSNVSKIIDLFEAGSGYLFLYPTAPLRYAAGLGIDKPLRGSLFWLILVTLLLIADY